MIKKTGGTLILAMGCILLGWVVYNLFVEMQPEAEGRSPVPATVLSLLMIAVGANWLFSRRAKQIRKSD